MGKLAELWSEYREQKDESKRQEIRENIWKIEDWMITQGYKKERTDFNNVKTFKVNRFAGKRDGGHLIPEGAKIGADRCGACKYNNKACCDPNDPYGHMAKV